MHCYLLDQTDVLVVGVLGFQGTGKSTMMSLLSANSPDDDQRSYVFRIQSQEVRERAGNQTSGTNFFISPEKIIYLETQIGKDCSPILSPAILDHLINNDRKLPPEYNLPHTYVEMQTAEMLKPSAPSPIHESSGSSGADEGIEYYPHIGSGGNRPFSFLPEYKGHPNLHTMISMTCLCHARSSHIPFSPKRTVFTTLLGFGTG